ncbi:MULTISPECIES: helix-turn-helix domain-containing protein [unclassified Phenylobacterium]|uniref:helix-turn-helix domain-containing protein n=1 Tax=unclassified Phenylobacterium TaxID=2640670 RepID=UPI000839F82A|nr:MULTISPECIES: helix-turn-helix domain-containing protein [unclassified Phenylobacterium]
MSPEDCRQLRLSLGVTAYELARQAGIVERTVVRFEAGLAQPRPVTLVALRKAFRRLSPSYAREA